MSLGTASEQPLGGDSHKCGWQKVQLQPDHCPLPVWVEIAGDSQHHTKGRRKQS